MTEREWNKEQGQDEEVELVRDPAELIEEDLENVAGGACGGGKGCCTGSAEVE